MVSHIIGNRNVGLDILEAIVANFRSYHGLKNESFWPNPDNHPDARMPKCSSNFKKPTNR